LASHFWCIQFNMLKPFHKIGPTSRYKGVWIDFSLLSNYKQGFGAFDTTNWYSKRASLPWHKILAWWMIWMSSTSRRVSLGVQFGIGIAEFFKLFLLHSKLQGLTHWTSTYSLEPQLGECKKDRTILVSLY